MRSACSKDLLEDFSLDDGTSDRLARGPRHRPSSGISRAVDEAVLARGSGPLLCWCCLFSGECKLSENPLPKLSKLMTRTTQFLRQESTRDPLPKMRQWFRHRTDGGGSVRAGASDSGDSRPSPSRGTSLRQRFRKPAACVRTSREVGFGEIGHSYLAK